jgi:hypothetical protein
VVGVNGSDRVVILPCPVGTTVYEICRACQKKIISAKPFDLTMLGFFGKTIFLTKDEAEAEYNKIINS